ncbi:GntR family transcriptional regulator [Metabacillus fastidiosus]|uniref:GntR family transcriptional regulator n=1 Tax=Metabacillus fastidiosus TaxID=1458 RepID=UPI003D2A1AB3
MSVAYSKSGWLINCEEIQPQNIEQYLQEQRQTVDEKNTLEFLKSDSEFHSYLIQIIDNQFIIPTFKNIRERLFHHGNLIYKKNPGLIKQSLDEHIQIIEAIKEKNVENAVDFMEQHLQNSKKIELMYV